MIKLDDEILKPKEFSNNDVAAFEANDVRQDIRKTERQILSAKENETDAIVSLGRPQWAGRAETRVRGKLWDFNACGLPKVWTYYGARGAGVNVHVLDTGVDMNHTAFAHCADRMQTRSFVPSYSGDRDGAGHGTWVVGKIVGAGIGIAPQAKMHSHKVLDDSGSGRMSFTNNALEWILEQEDMPHVINMSLGGAYPSARLNKLVWKLYKRGALVIVAAGNEDSDAPCYPAHCDGVVAVAAVNKRKARAWFSNYGGNIDISAPGVACYSTYPGENFRLLQGTSMASPTVAGLVTLGVSHALQRGHDEGPGMRDMILKALETSAEDLGDVGKDPLYGVGCIHGGQFFEKLHESLLALGL